jgi:glycosyltransferase involved in cell wall biosynthesis
MKLLHLYSGNLYGGVERMLGTLAHLQDLYPKLEHSFALCFHGKLWDELQSYTSRLYHLGEVRTRYPWTVLLSRSRFSKILKEAKPDWVVFHTPWPQAIYGGTAKRAGYKIATWFHDIPHPEKWLDRWAGFTIPDRIIANSHYTAASIGKLFKSPEPTILYYSAEVPMTEPAPEVREQLRSAEGVRPDEVVLFQASRFERWKGLHVFVQALTQLKEIPGWVGWLAGSPQKQGEEAYLQELKQIASNGGISSRLKFLGWRSDVPQLMQAADVFCQPNTGPEPFGLVFTEALSSRLPVVATSIGGAKEIVTAECGILVPPEEPNQVAEALKTLIQDRALRRKLGDAGPGRALQLVDPKRQMQALEALLQQEAR